MKIWVQVDEPVKILGKEKFFGNPLCVCVCGVTTKYNCTYLLPFKFSNGMIKSELNNGVQKLVLSICPLPLKWIKCQVLTKTHCSFVCGQVQS